ncbi:MAG: domain containing protein [Pedosphaera sp.]|nr:domain containing protein [Pedosphaera sp.]
MARLLFNFGKTQGWEIPLKPGLNTLGRSLENDFTIEHHSVSGCHCQVVMEDGGVMVRDLGSTNGTFIDLRPVQEAALASGQTLKLGDIELLFDSDTPEELTVIHPALPVAAMPASGAETIEPSIPVAATPGTSGDLLCKNHRRFKAQLQCKECGTLYCHICVTMKKTAGAVKRFCGACGGECERLSVLLLVRPEEGKSFYASLPEAFKYPFQGDGWVLMAAGTFFYMFVDFVGHARSFGVGSMVAILVVSVFVYGYLFGYLMRIIASTYEGMKEMPNWPEFNGWEDVMVPLLQALATLLASFAPGLIALGAFYDQPWGGMVTRAILCLGIFYLPMSFLAVALFDSVTILNPLFIIPSILRVLKPYLAACGVLAAVVVLHVLVNFLLEKYVKILVLPGLISGFLGLYFLTVEMRVLGILYRTEREALGWFKK